MTGEMIPSLSNLPQKTSAGAWNPPSSSIPSAS